MRLTVTKTRACMQEFNTTIRMLNITIYTLYVSKHKLKRCMYVIMGLYALRGKKLTASENLGIGIVINHTTK